MITASSPIYRFSSRASALAEKRAQVLISLCRVRLPFEDIAMALNCSESLVRSMLDYPFRGPVGDSISPINLEMLPKSECGALLTGPLAPAAGARKVREVLMRHLQAEIRSWLGTFNMSEEDRRSAIEEAGKRLDQSVFYMESNYRFDQYRVSQLIFNVWSPFLRCSSREPFWPIAGRWLAGWVHFWIAYPTIWDPVIDLEFARDAAPARAA
jgi:hypothetical protein